MPPTLDLSELKSARDWGRTVIWCGESVRARVESTLSYPIVNADAPLAEDVETLIVVGGGTLIDQAKRVTRRDRRRRLIAIPSIWGSGAEASPVITYCESGQKKFTVSEEFVPDYCCIWPGLIETIPPTLARWACGDVWAHTLEGFLSPLSSDSLRNDLATLIRSLLELPLNKHPRWFEVSAQACAAQARSSVGLVHGLAHVLEPVLETAGAAMWGHARLCSRVLWPVMKYNAERFIRWSDMFVRFDLSPESVLHTVRMLFDNDDYAFLVPYFATHWKTIVRDPCTRTNCTLVRLNDLAYFAEFRSI